MHWNSASEFFAMGGYAFYVWGSLGVTALALLLEPILVARRRHNVVTRLQRELRAEELEATAARKSA
ncbi:heme exporter protein D [Oryzomicrobium terrae]|uniref:Heme exporter protein D n=1 Tax=Oryzomicrobium terrae TaxID=1735038 RepID=A0A5C1E5Z1_9RHOO|nr:heme exporter protein CcmD [Oryzomicrobium terrae]QEL63698.1 heme exporter protein D [Oryzomicrobium terrae]